MRLACSWERFEGSAEATKGACFWIWALGWAGGRAGGHRRVGGVEGWGWGGSGVVLESSGSNNHPLRFLSYLERCGGWAREAGGRGRWGGPD